MPKCYALGSRIITKGLQESKDGSSGKNIRPGHKNPEMALLFSELQTKLEKVIYFGMNYTIVSPMMV